MIRWAARPSHQIPPAYAPILARPSVPGALHTCIQMATRDWFHVSIFLLLLVCRFSSRPLLMASFVVSANEWIFAAPPAQGTGQLTLQCSRHTIPEDFRCSTSRTSPKSEYSPIFYLGSQICLIVMQGLIFFSTYVPKATDHAGGSETGFKSHS
jgi:hypothetical protein